MKKYQLVIVFCLLLSKVLWGQSSNGYDKATWGMSVAEVMKLYPSLQEATQANFDPFNIMTDFSVVGVKHYVKNGDGAGILKQHFYFYENKLFWVDVTYDTERVSSLTLRNKIESAYGKVTDFAPNVKKYEYSMTVKVSGFYRNINKNMKITLIVMDLNGPYTGRKIGLGISYCDPIIVEKIFAAYEKADEDSVSF